MKCEKKPWKCGKALKSIIANHLDSIIFLHFGRPLKKGGSFVRVDGWTRGGYVKWERMGKLISFIKNGYFFPARSKREKKLYWFDSLLIFFVLLPTILLQSRVYFGRKGAIIALKDLSWNPKYSILVPYWISNKNIVQLGDISPILFLNCKPQLKALSHIEL